MRSTLVSAARRSLNELVALVRDRLPYLPHADERVAGPHAAERYPRLGLTIHYEDAGNGWILATVAEVPGAISQGRTRREARSNVIDALVTIFTPDEQLAGEPLTSDDERLTLTVSSSAAT
jgi:predicted RNase H-like HicB family nuclease